MPADSPAPVSPAAPWAPSAPLARSSPPAPPDRSDGTDRSDPEFDVTRAYRLNPCVALRPEPFGALAYHFGTRRLSFLKAPGLVDLVRGLERHPSAGDALAGVPGVRRAALLRALASLAATEMIVPL